VSRLARLRLNLTGSDTAALVRSLAGDLLPEDDRPPAELEVDYEDSAPAEWLTAVADEVDEIAIARWDEADGAAWLSHAPGRIVRVDVAFPPSRNAVVDRIGGLPFSVASLPSHNDVWEREFGYRAPGFDEGHTPHGWACAFRGDGHDRLVSRRWLEHGPWERIRAPQDTSFVQFHDPEATPGAALEAARCGHARMGITDAGGYLQAQPAFATDLAGLYDRATETMKLVVDGRDVSQREMLDACQLRRLRRDERVTTVAYIFVEPERAEAHLAELWLRELQCWTIVDGEERRLDDSSSLPTALRR
jgi:hypothetical protein